MAFKTSSKQKLSTISAISSSVGTGASGPVILSVYVTDSSYVNLDDTAVSTSGGYLKLIGTGFVTGCIAYVNGVAVTTTFVSATEVRAVVPALSNGTYSLMVFNSAGSGAIWATGLVASGFPTVTTSSYSNQGNVLNIQLLASGDGTLVYTLQNGSTLPTGVALSSGGVLSGTATDLTSATVVNFTILVNDAQLQTVQQAITLSLTFGDDYFKNTVLAIQANTTPFISDASTNNLVLTPSGSVKANESNPFQDGFYSGYFNGTSDYLSMPSVAGLAFGAGDFTVEMWVNLLTGTTGPELFNHGNFHINFRSATTIAITNDASVLSNVSNAISLNTWTHVAAVRASGTMTIYINGVPNTPATGQTFTFTQGQTQIGSSNFASGSYANMYMSNLRVLKGVALYTEAFPPPTQPLTTTEAATTYVAPATVDYLVVAGGGGGGYFNGGAGGGAGGVLTGTDFAVAANTAITVTVGTGGAGSTAVSAAGGNGTASVFSTITTVGGGGGGSGDGAGYIGQLGGSGGGGATTGSTVGAGGAGTAGQGYAGGAGSTDGTYRAGGGGGGAGGAGTASTSAIGGGPGGIGISSSITGTATYYGGGGGGGGFTSPRFGGVGGLGGGGKGVITGRAGNGIANTGGGGGGIYNSGSPGAGGAGGSGVVIIRYADTASPAVTTGNPDIIVSGGYRIYRFTKSGTIKFRNTSSPAVTAAQTVLLTCQSNRFKDSSTTASAITVAGTPKITQVIPYTQPSNTYGSGYFNGTSDYLTVPSNAALAFGTGDFTIETWLYLNAIPSGSPEIVSIGDCRLNFRSGPNIAITNNTTVLSNLSGTLLINTWYHIAAVRASGNMTIYLNGVANTVATGQTYSFSQAAGQIATANGASGPFINCYISNLRAIKGTALYTAAFTPPTAPLTAITNTSLLTLQTKSAHNNSTYLETSGYNNILAPTGTPSQGTFSPFSPAGWSYYFTAATDYLTTPNTVMGATAFTVECWINTTNKTAYAGLCKNGAAADWTASDIYVIGLDASGNSIWIYNGTGSISLNGTTTVTDGKWHHVAFVYNGTNYRLYIDGVQQATTTAAAMTQSTRIHNIGCDIRNSRPWIGYISNFRMVNGTAIYTTAFTPPIAPLTAVSGTVILTCQDNRFKDNAKDILTVAGTPKVQAFGPFKPSGVYDPVIHGGSVYIDGSSVISTTSNAASFGASADFTIETWINWPAATASNQSYLELVGTTRLILGRTSTGFRLFNDGTAKDFTYTFNTNAWYHIALVRFSGTISVYINGALATTAYANVTNWAFTTLYIGRNSDAAEPMTGYISNLAITKGVAKYTSNFYVPTAPVARTSSTVLLLDSTSAAIIDASGRNNMLTVGDAKISTAVEKYGAGSMYFDGTGDYITIPSSTTFTLSADFTIELWAYMNSYAASGGGGATFLSGTNAANNWLFAIDAASIIWYWNAANVLSATVANATGEWIHLAVSRSGSTLSIFKNGILVGSTTNSSSYTLNNSVLYVGAQSATAGFVNGYIDDLRITKGVARYTANFTPPTAISVS